MPQINASVNSTLIGEIKQIQSERKIESFSQTVEDLLHEIVTILKKKKLKSKKP